jgi:hypothetical protein
MGISGMIISRKKLIESIRKHGGHVERTCKEAGISTGTFYRYQNDDPQIAEEIEKARDLRSIDEACLDEDIIDKAYAALLALLDKKDVAIVISTLRTLGRKRNFYWSTVIPTNQTDNTKVTITHQVADDRPKHINAVQAEVVSGGLHQCDDGGKDEGISAVPSTSRKGHSVLEFHNSESA